MGGQVDLAILLVQDFEFPGELAPETASSPSPLPPLPSNSPLIQSDIVLHKQQVLIRQVQRPQCRGEVQLF